MMMMAGNEISRDQQLPLRDYSQQQLGGHYARNPEAGYVLMGNSLLTISGNREKST